MNYFNHPYPSRRNTVFAKEGTVAAEAVKGLGHDIEVLPDGGTFGREEIIWRNPETGVLAVGSEYWTDGAVAAW